jgi:hypothetical protein
METCLCGRVLLSYILYFFGLRRLNSEKGCESIVKLFSDSLKFKISLSDLVSITLVKMTILKRHPFGISLTLFRTDWTSYKK